MRLIRKFAILSVISGLLVGCAGTETAAVADSVPGYGYKKELQQYRGVQNQRPSASLWANANSHGTLFRDYKTKVVGDIIIVKIVENAKANNSSNVNASKKSSYSGQITGMMGLPVDMGISNFLGSGSAFNPSLGASTDNSFSGTGANAKNDSMTATLAAIVIDVLPSGNLIIEGKREIIVDQQKQIITVKGIVRQEDIEPNNVIPSTAIADAQISYSGDGVINDATRKGWFATFIDWIWPF